MPSSIDTVALGWVRAPLARQIGNAEAALVEYSRDTGHKKPLLQCLWALHHITATVRVLGLNKAEMLTLEMERGLQRLYQEKVLAERRNLTMGGLMRALRILPAYLDHVQRSGIDTGRGLEPCVNDLRRWEGERPRPPALFFHFEIPPQRGISSDAAASSDSAVRQTAQLSLVPYLQGVKAILGQAAPAASVVAVARIAVKMQQLFRGTEAERFWLLQTGLCEGIAAGLIIPDEGVAQIFKAGTFMIKHAREYGSQLNPAIDLDRLAQQLLFYIAACRARPLYIGYLWQLFGITSDTLTDAGRILIHSDALMTALEAGLDRLNRLAGYLEAAGNDGTIAPELLSCASEAVDRLVAAGEPGHADALQAGQALMRQLAEPRGNPDPARRGQLLARLAGTIVSAQLDLELRLRHDGRAPPGGVEHEARVALVATTMDWMVRVGQQLDRALRRQALNRALDAQRQGVAGMQALATALNSYLNESADGHEALREVVASAALGGADPVQLQQLATEFAAGLQDPPAQQVVQQCLQQLGVIREALEHAAMRREAAVIGRCEAWLAQFQGPDLDASLLLQVAEAFAQLELHLQRVRSGAPEAAGEALERARAQVESLQPAADQERQAAGDDAAAEPESIPAELREIFLEESGDIIQQLQQLLPAGDTDLPATDQLREIRRHFHTFKGNGRAVGAHRLADLGAAVQDMLDRLLDGDLSLDPPLRSLLQDVIQALPELVAGAGEDAANIVALRARCLQACRGAGESAGMRRQPSWK